MIREETDFDLTGYNTFRLPARADRFIDYDGLPGELEELYGRGVFAGPWLHIGGGSNLLFASGRVKATVLHLPATDDGWNIEACAACGGDVLVHARAGMDLDRLIAVTTSHGFYGLENLSDIPGQVGAGAVQNVGAYGVEIADRLERVDTFDTLTGQRRSFRRDDCGYGYRTSRFKAGDDAGRYVVDSVTLRLSRDPRKAVLTYGPLSHLAPDASPEAIRERVKAVRRSKLPSVAEYGSAGSFFTNPVITRDDYARAIELSGLDIPFHPVHDDAGMLKLSAAWLIDRCGMKGHSEGGASVWPHQPLVIYNTGSATASDIIALERDIVEAVAGKFGVTLRPEVQYIY